MIISKLMKAYACQDWKRNCDKCNLYFGCDRKPLTLKEINKEIEEPSKPNISSKQEAKK